MRKLRRLTLIVLALLFAGGTLLAQTVTIGPTDAIGFDYFDADVTGYSVSYFQASYDLGTWVQIAVPSDGFVDANTLNGAHTYKAAPPFTSGNHAVQFRACNAWGCGGASPSFPFAVASVPSAIPTNIRKVAR